MEPETPITFTIPAPPEHHHNKMRTNASSVNWITLHNGNKPGHVVPPEGDGLEYDYTLSSVNPEL